MMCHSEPGCILDGGEESAVDFTGTHVVCGT